jgi:hypothetical protein
MKYLNLQTPSQGRALAYEDLDALEKLAIFPQNILRGMGNCVVDGCALDGSGVLNGGVVWLGGRLYEFPGGTLRDSARNVDNKYLIVQPTFTFDPPRLAAVGSTVAGPRNEIAVLTDTVTTGQAYVKIDQPLQTIRLAHRLQELTRAPGTVEWITTIDSDYTATGRGQGRALGWALCNGQNGTIDLRGRFVLGHNPGNNLNGAYSTTGIHNTGGAERVALELSEIPSHTHSTNTQSYYGNITYDGGSSGGSSPDWNKRSSPTIGYAGGNNGQTQPHQNMPPYYVLAARQWIGL